LDVNDCMVVGAAAAVAFRLMYEGGFTLDVKGWVVVGAAAAVAFRLMNEEGFGVGRFHPGRSVVRVGASLAFAALIEPDEREAAKEASVLATFVAFEKLELWGKLPKASFGLFLGSY